MINEKEFTRKFRTEATDLSKITKYIKSVLREDDSSDKFLKLRDALHTVYSTYCSMMILTDSYKPKSSDNKIAAIKKATE